MKKEIGICMIIIGMMVSSAEAQSEVFVPCIEEEEETETVDTISPIEPEVVSIHICERDYLSFLGSESLIKHEIDSWEKKGSITVNSDRISAVYHVINVPNNGSTWLYYLGEKVYYLSKTRPVFENDTLVLQPAETVTVAQPAARKKKPCDSPGMKGVSKNGGNHSF